MKSRGFTLIELLGVVVILAIIVFLTVPIVSNIIGNAKETVYQKNINSILNAAYDWSIENPLLLPDIDNSTYITLGALKNKGYIDTSVINTLDEKEFPNELVIKITNVHNVENVEEKSFSKKSGDYLFTAMIDNLDSTQYELLAPILTFSNLDYSNNAYVADVEVGDIFENPEYSIDIRSTEEEINYDVIVNIVKDGVTVSKLDTSKLGIYHFYYTVIDELGYASTTNLNVIVKDTTAPVLTIPGNAVITLTDTEYNLMEGASCTDNSGDCTITTTGEITFGVANSYVITYTAKDSTGNTVSQNRTIRVQ